MKGLLWGLFFIGFFIFLLFYIILRKALIKRFMELGLAVLFAFLLKNLGLADELAYFGFGFTLIMAYYIRKI